MKPKKIYKIRHKPSKTFISLGYAGKTTWLIQPWEQIMRSNTIQDKPQDYELVTYETKEISIEQILSKDQLKQIKL